LVEVFGAAGLEVRAAAAIDQQRITGENVAAPEVTHTAGRMPRGMHHADLFTADLQHITVAKLPGGRGNAAALRRRRAGAGVFRQLPRAGDVVGMGMRLHRPQ